MAVDLTLAKQQLRVVYDDEDALIQQCLDAAVSAVESHTGYLLSRREVSQTESGFLSYFTLYKGPNPDTISLKYTDADGVQQTLSGLIATGNRLYPDAPWPTAQKNRPVTITYMAGTDTPEADLVQAVLFLVGHYKKNAEAITVSNTNPSELPLAVEWLCRPYRAVGI